MSSFDESVTVASAPVEFLPDDDRAPARGRALCLSGGGYRAMLFHLGALWRLNDLGLLATIDRVSSVSGGSITAATLGMNWSRLAFDANGIAGAFVAMVVEPVRELARHTIDEGAVLGGIFEPGVSISDKVQSAYRKRLFGHATLQDLPDRPRFVINATNVQSGALWRFSKPYMADYRVGMVKSPTVELAAAVTASSAFPPFLSPFELDLDPATVQAEGGDLSYPPYTERVVLTDGGVYDNLGLETAWKRYTTILVSDAGGAFSPDPKPKRDWARHAYRVLDLIDHQVRSLRVRQLVASYAASERTGAYWGIRTGIDEYAAPNALPCPLAATTALANTPTRLAALSDLQQERLVNWGYAISDAALRRYFDPSLAAPAGFPYPAAGVG